MFDYILYFIVKSNIKLFFNLMVLFPIGIELERVGVVASIRRSCAMRYLQENNRNKVIWRRNADSLSNA